MRARLAGKATSEVDKLTIEIVGLVFDRINQDRHVPGEIKKLLQRLQFPMIKVALTDAERFAAAAEAPRQLLDRIASTSIGWTSEGEDNRRYLAEVQKAVHQVLTSIEDGMTAFARALEDFEAYLNDERTRDDDPVARARRALAEAETREVMAINAMIRIRSVFEGVQIESYLRDFLLGTWVRVLVAAALADRSANAERMNGDLVRRYLGIVPELLWSVQPKVNTDDRKRLVGTIPPVLSSLRDGLLMIQWPAPQMQEFFARLMTSHAQAVKAIELAHGVAAPVETSTLRIKLDGIDFTRTEMPDTADGELHVSDDVVRQVIAANHVEVDHLSLPEAAQNTIPGTMGVDAATLDEHIAAFRRGDWFNLRVGNSLERVRLRWVSPRKTLYLFTPADGRRAHSLSPETLRAYLGNGDLQPVEAEPLFARAVHGIVADLQHAAQVAASS